MRGIFEIVICLFCISKIQGQNDLGQLSSDFMNLLSNIIKEEQNLLSLKDNFGSCTKCQFKPLCSYQPCYSNVSCTDFSNDFRCGNCPLGYEGNGKTCNSVACGTKTCNQGQKEFVNSVEEIAQSTYGLYGDILKQEQKINSILATINTCRICKEDTVNLNEIENSLNGLKWDLSNQTKLLDTVEEILNQCTECKVKKLCQYKPCYPNVDCVDTDYGFKCGYCPLGYQGNGITCNKIESAGQLSKYIEDMKHDLDDLFITFQKEEMKMLYTEPKVLNCQTCKVSIPELCTKYRPCFPNVTCTNTSDSFTCGKCPIGYEGNGYVCKNPNMPVKNECDKTPCFPGAVCYNDASAKGYHCGSCPTGYEGNGVDCKAIPNKQLPVCGNNTYCSANAYCLDPAFKCCKCKYGYAGNGLVCGPDDDFDGYPNEKLNCPDTYCQKDNCPSIPNSGQEDSDKNGIGDACSDDIDGDGIKNAYDNCPFVPNVSQKDSDGDKVGDECDNCPTVKNPSQADKNQNKIGDACDKDIDGDGILNEKDNCPFVSNKDQSDKDGDKIGDLCDNCPNKFNPSQADSDDDFVGNECDTNKDSDGDGIQDDLDTDNTKIGDACEKPNQMNVCSPVNDKNSKPDFRSIVTVFLNPSSNNPPNWIIYDQGAEVQQTLNSDPSLAVLSSYSFGDVDFEGTFYVEIDPTFEDDDFMGIVFGYQRNSHFYVVTWKKGNQTNENGMKAIQGVELKLITSNTGPSQNLADALYYSGSSLNQAKLLWKDPTLLPWEFYVSYRWFLRRRPNTGEIRLQIFQASSKIVDSGILIDKTLKGGRLGLYCNSQALIKWSNMRHRCNSGPLTN